MHGIREEDALAAVSVGRGRRRKEQKKIRVQSGKELLLCHKVYLASYRRLLVIAYKVGPVIHGESV